MQTVILSFRFDIFRCENGVLHYKTEYVHVIKLYQCEGINKILISPKSFR